MPEGIKGKSVRVYQGKHGDRCNNPAEQHFEITFHGQRLARLADIILQGCGFILKLTRAREVIRLKLRETNKKGTTSAVPSPSIASLYIMSIETCTPGCAGLQA